MQPLLRLLADPTRLRILAALEPEELAVNELADVLAMGQSRISNHLRLLKGEGAIGARRDGAWTFYRNALHDDAERSALWSAVRAGLVDEAEFLDDQERRAAVLDTRRRLSRDHFAAAAGTPDFAFGTVRAEILATLVPRERIAVDAGCGDGYLTEMLAERFDEVWAVDHAPERLAAARARVQGGNVQFHQGEIDALPLPARSCDLVFLSFVLHHVPAIGAALKEARRVLKPGGRVVVADLCPHKEESLRQDEGDFRLGVDPDDLCAELVAAGFDDVARFPIEDRWIASARTQLPLFAINGVKPRERAKRAPKNKTSKRNASSKKSRQRHGVTK